MNPSNRHQDVRSQLIATRQSFHALLAWIPDDAWEAPTPNPHWNVRQLLYHVILAPRFLLQDVRLIQSGVHVAPPAWLFDRVNIVYTRWRARNATKESIGQEYDLAHQNVLALLDRLTTEDLERGAMYPGLDPLLSGHITIADLYDYLSLHFAQHAIDVVRGVERWRDRSPLERIGDSNPPSGWRRWFFRLPLWLYRNDLGWLLGERFLLLHHVGRKSGRAYQTVVEVAGRSGEDGSYLVASGWGEQADWYQNLRAHPRTTIQVGRRRMEVVAQFFSAEECAEEMVRYARRHPRLAPQLARMVGYRVEQSERGYRALGREVVRFVRLRPQPQRHNKPARDET